MTIFDDIMKNLAVAIERSISESYENATINLKSEIKKEGDSYRMVFESPDEYDMPDPGVRRTIDDMAFVIPKKVVVNFARQR